MIKNDMSHESSSKATSLTETAYQKLKAAIIHCELPPGSQFSEQQIAQMFQVSRTPVHQAVVRLENEGWVTFLTRKGLQIKGVTAEEMHHVYEVLMSLEALGVSRLASRPQDIHDGIDAALDAARIEGEQALEAKDLMRWALADDCLHTLFVEESGNPHLSRLARNVREKAHRARLFTLAERPLPEASNADHKLINQAIFNRKPEEARQLLEMHRRRGMDTLLPILEKLTNRPSFLR